MSVAYLDIHIDTIECGESAFQFRVPIDTSTAEKMRKQHVTIIRLVHCLDAKQFPGITPTHDLKSFKMKGG